MCDQINAHTEKIRRERRAWYLLVAGDVGQLALDNVRYNHSNYFHDMLLYRYARIAWRLALLGQEQG